MLQTGMWKTIQKLDENISLNRFSDTRIEAGRVEKGDTAWCQPGVFSDLFKENPVTIR